MSVTTGLKDLIRGDTKFINIELKDKDGNPIDLTGSTIWFTLKENIKDPDTAAAIQKVITNHTDPTNGKTRIVLESSDTQDLQLGSYHYDIQLVDNGGNVTTVLIGRLKVLADVTRSV